MTITHQGVKYAPLLTGGLKMLLQYGIYSMAEKRDNEESINFMLDISRSLYNSFDKNLIMMVWKNYYYSKGPRYMV